MTVSALSATSSIRIDWFSATEADVYFCPDRYHETRVGCVSLEAGGFRGYVHTDQRSGDTTLPLSDIDSAARDIVDHARVTDIRGTDLDVRVGRSAPPEGMFAVPVEIRRLIEDGQAAFWDAGISNQGLGWLTDASTRVWTARHSLRWLDGNGESPSQWGSRERVISDVHYDLMLAATYVLNAAAASDLNRKPSPAILRWAASVVSHGAHHPLGGDHRYSIRERAGIAY